jgi:hypothetical protein
VSRGVKLENDLEKERAYNLFGEIKLVIYLEQVDQPFRLCTPALCRKKNLPTLHPPLSTSLLSHEQTTGALLSR